MRVTIWKTPLTVTDDQEVVLPEGATPLTVGVQYTEPVMWWKLPNPEAEKVTHHVRCVGTGSSYEEDDLVYVGTTIHLDGRLVWHWFVD